MIARAASINAEQRAISKPRRHPDMARLKSRPFVKSLRIDAGVIPLQAIARVGIAMDFHGLPPSSPERQTNRRDR
jgi:hypothetical protein